MHDPLASGTLNCEWLEEGEEEDFSTKKDGLVEIPTFQLGLKSESFTVAIQISQDPNPLNDKIKHTFNVEKQSGNVH